MVTVIPRFEMTITCLSELKARALAAHLAVLEVDHRLDGLDVVVPHRGDGLFVWGVAEIAGRLGYANEQDACSAAVAACENVGDHIRRHWGTGAPLAHPSIGGRFDKGPLLAKIAELETENAELKRDLRAEMYGTGSG